MQNIDKTNYEYVFVCGLRRSGTSVLARNVARLEDCTGFRNTGVLEGRESVFTGRLPIRQRVRRRGWVRFRPPCAPDRDVASPDAREHTKAAAKLGKTLGSRQGDPRGKNPRTLSATLTSAPYCGNTEPGFTFEGMASF
jgi:hypothetical protein